MGTRCADHATPVYLQKLALTSPTSGGRSVGIVRSRTKATEFVCFVVCCGFFCAQDWKFLVLLIPSRVNTTSSVSTMSGRICSCSCCHIQNCMWLARSPHKRWCVVVGDMDGNHHGTKLSIPMSVLCQLSWKCYIFLHLGFTAPYSLRKKPVNLRILCTVSNVVWNSAMWVILMVFHNSSPTVSLQKPCNARQHILHL